MSFLQPMWKCPVWGWAERVRELPPLEKNRRICLGPNWTSCEIYIWIERMHIINMQMVVTGEAAGYPDCIRWGWGCKLFPPIGIGTNGGLSPLHLCQDHSRGEKDLPHPTYACASVALGAINTAHPLIWGQEMHNMTRGPWLNLISVPTTLKGRSVFVLPLQPFCLSPFDIWACCFLHIPSHSSISWSS